MRFLGVFALSIVAAILAAMARYEAVGGPSHEPDSSYAALGTAGVVLLAGVLLGGFAEVAKRDARERREQEAARAAEADKQREEAAKQRLAQRTRAAQAEQLASSTGRQAMELARGANHHIHVCGQWIDAMKTHRQNHALSPFWESVEGGLISIAAYLASIRQIIDLSNAHHEACTAYRKNGGVSSQLPAFPIAASTVDVRAALERKRQLDEIIYQAQTDYEFATIFEQRRTTTAVIVGFRDLNSAIQELPAALETAHRNLQLAAR